MTLPYPGQKRALRGTGQWGRGFCGRQARNQRGRAGMYSSHLWIITRRRLRRAGQDRKAAGEEQGVCNVAIWL